MDESPLAKLVEHATAAHAAVTAQRESARQIAEQARQEYRQGGQTPGGPGDASPN